MYNEFDQYYRRAYTKCACDKYTLNVPSFRQWAKEMGFEYWMLSEMAAPRYAYLWEVYEHHADQLRRNGNAVETVRQQSESFRSGGTVGGS